MGQLLPIDVSKDLAARVTKIRKDDMGGANNTNGMKKSTKFWLKNLQKTCLGYIAVGSMITSKWNLNVPGLKIGPGVRKPL
jgi:hypothetical protein